MARGIFFRSPRPLRRAQRLLDERIDGIALSQDLFPE
jgi:hypothetical protein